MINSSVNEVPKEHKVKPLYTKEFLRKIKGHGNMHKGYDNMFKSIKQGFSQNIESGYEKFEPRGGRLSRQVKV